jgi:hypothetical protein
VVAALKDAGAEVTLWPMLDDADGRWASAWNAQAFADFARRVLDRARDRHGLLVDLEPPIARMRAWLARPLSAVVKDLAAPGSAARAPVRAAGADVLASLVREAREGGRAVEAAVAPFLLFDREEAGFWSRALGTPLCASYTHVTAMAYTSILEGWSRRVLRRKDAEAFLGVLGDRAIAKEGPRAGLSLGASPATANPRSSRATSPSRSTRACAIWCSSSSRACSRGRPRTRGWKPSPGARRENRRARASA